MEKNKNVCFFFGNRFCSECKLKVLEAYDLLMDDTDYKYQDKQGFCASLYDGKINDCYVSELDMIQFK